MSATLFNDGSSSGGFDRTGDVHTFVNIHVAPSGPFEVFYQALRCNNGNCSSQTTVPGGFGQFTPVGLREDVTLRIERQVAASQIIFSATNQRTGVMDTASIFVPPFVTQDPIPPERQFKEVDVSHRLENCTGERTAASIDVSFDDLRAGM